MASCRFLVNLDYSNLFKNKIYNADAQWAIRIGIYSCLVILNDLFGFVVSCCSLLMPLVYINSNHAQRCSEKYVNIISTLRVPIYLVFSLNWSPKYKFVHLENLQFNCLFMRRAILCLKISNRSHFTKHHIEINSPFSAYFPSSFVPSLITRTVWFQGFA